MKIKSPETLISIVVIALIIRNFVIQEIYIPQMTLSWPAKVRLFPPGYKVEPLRKYLGGVRIAGYYSDLYDDKYWFNPLTMQYFQSAQNALSPVLLDAVHCFDHDVVIFDCNSPGCFRDPSTKHGYRTVYVLNERIAISYRK